MDYFSTDLGTNNNHLGSLYTFVGENTYGWTITDLASLSSQDYFYSCDFKHTFNTGQYPIQHKIKFENIKVGGRYAEDYNFTMIIQVSTYWTDPNNYGTYPKINDTYYGSQTLSIEFGKIFSSQEMEFPANSNNLYCSVLLYRNDSLYETDLQSIARQNGYDDGYNTGLTVGYNNGVSSTTGFGGVFSLLGTAFESASSVLNTYVIGGLTIGGLLGIPLAITVLVVLFKIARK